MQTRNIKFIALIIVCCLAVATLLMLTYANSDNATTDNLEVKKSESNDSKVIKENAQKNDDIQQNVKVLILDRSGDIPLKNTQVELQSNDGTRCIQSPCPMNEKSWTDATDNEGYILVPIDLIQLETTLKPIGYGFARLPYDKDTDTYTLRVAKQ